MAALFGGGGGGGQSYVVQQPRPQPPAEVDPSIDEARRKELEADRRATGRSATILTGYATALSNPSVLKQTLGGA